MDLLLLYTTDEIMRVEHYFHELAAGVDEL